MISRRRFAAFISTSLMALGLKKCATQTKSQTFEGIGTVDRPLVVSTWNNPIANNTAMDILQTSESLLDAIESGINTVEADPNDRSVGYGGRPDRDGNVTLDACIMDSKGQAGSVTFLANIKHAISVARRVMEETPHVMLSGRGALQFAEEQGFKSENLLTSETEEAYKNWLREGLYKPKINIESHDTIGLLAMNSQGDLAGGCSTSGLAYKMQGRVGDSPIIGAGLFVDNKVGAAVATGLGELILRNCSSFLAVELMRSGKSAQEACKEAVIRIVNNSEVKEAQIGLITLSKGGEVGAFSIHPGFVYTVSNGKKTSKMEAPSYFT